MYVRVDVDNNREFVEIGSVEDLTIELFVKAGKLYLFNIFNLTGNLRTWFLFSCRRV